MLGGVGTKAKGIGAGPGVAVHPGIRGICGMQTARGSSLLQAGAQYSASESQLLSLLLSPFLSLPPPTHMHLYLCMYISIISHPYLFIHPSLPILFLSSLSLPPSPPLLPWYAFPLAELLRTCFLVPGWLWILLSTLNCTHKPQEVEAPHSKQLQASCSASAASWESSTLRAGTHPTLPFTKTLSCRLLQERGTEARRDVARWGCALSSGLTWASLPGDTLFHLAPLRKLFRPSKTSPSLFLNRPWMHAIQFTKKLLGKKKTDLF